MKPLKLFLLAYHYFANKEAIFTTLLQYALQGALELMQRARVQPGTPWDRLRWLTSEILRGARLTTAFEWCIQGMVFGMSYWGLEPARLPDVDSVLRMLKA